MPFSYVIEHMEDDDETPKALPDWVELEYKQMRALAGPSAHVHFTHLSQAASNSLSASFALQDTTSSGLAKGAAHQIGVLELMKQENVDIQRVCLLDPKATAELTPDDAIAFDWFLFGGILGDDPPRDRTSELRALGFPGRRLGPVQMTTDTALGVTKIIVDDKVPMQDIPFIDHPTIVFSKQESVEMPFRYIVGEDEQPKLPPGMREHLQEDLNRGFEF